MTIMNQSQLWMQILLVNCKTKLLEVFGLWIDKLCKIRANSWSSVCLIDKENQTKTEIFEKTSRDEIKLVDLLYWDRVELN